MDAGVDGEPGAEADRGSCVKSSSDGISDLTGAGRVGPSGGWLREAKAEVRANAVCEVGVSAGWRVRRLDGPAAVPGGPVLPGLPARDQPARVLLRLRRRDPGLAGHVPGD